MQCLAERPRSVGELADGLPISRQAVSQHLRVLKDAGLVADQAMGTRRVYRLNPAGVSAMRDQLDTFWRRALDGSLYQKLVLGEVGGRIPDPDLRNERQLHEFLAAAAEARLLRSAHDVAGGGLAFALAEAAIFGAVGVRATADAPFAEGDGAAVISARPADVAQLAALAGGLPLVEIGATGGVRIELAGEGAATLGLDEAAALYEGAIPAAMGEMP